MLTLAITVCNGETTGKRPAGGKAAPRVRRPAPFVYDIGIMAAARADQRGNLLLHPNVPGARRRRRRAVAAAAALALALVGFGAGAADQPLYKNPHAPLAARVADLLSR